MHENAILPATLHTKGKLLSRGLNSSAECSRSGGRHPYVISAPHGCTKHQNHPRGAPIAIDLKSANNGDSRARRHGHYEAANVCCTDSAFPVDRATPGSTASENAPPPRFGTLPGLQRRKKSKPSINPRLSSSKALSTCIFISARLAAE